jgi:hypothetical protein
VAAVGNSDEAPADPWPFASYPAALPHVLGVGALTQSGNVPSFSDRDAIYDDIAAPGVGIFSTLPTALTGLRPDCAPQGYSDCGSDEFVDAEGTSFAAPQVTAAAAVLLALNPALTASQVETLLEHSADDVSPATGCLQCKVGRDSLSGWGRLDVARAVQALSGPLPMADRYEPNDDAGVQAHAVRASQQTVAAAADYYDDPVDVYRVALKKHQRLTAKLNASWTAANVKLELWRPGATTVFGRKAVAFRAAQSLHRGAVQQLAYTAPTAGSYYVEVRVASPGFGPYTLTLTR